METFAECDENLANVVFMALINNTLIFYRADLIYQVNQSLSTNYNLSGCIVYTLDNYDSYPKKSNEQWLGELQKHLNSEASGEACFNKHEVLVKNCFVLIKNKSYESRYFNTFYRNGSFCVIKFDPAVWPYYN